MSLRQQLAAYSGKSVIDFYRSERVELIRNERQFGLFDMIELYQPAGSYPDPASDNYVMLVPLRSDCRMRCDFGAGRFEQMFVSELSLATPGTICEYEVDGDHHFLGISFPARRIASLLREISPHFPGHFGPLHSSLFRDNAVRDLALKIWRAAKGDAHAPVLDPDTALMTLASLLLRHAHRGVAGQELRYHLSPATRRRIIEFIDDHIDEDLPLFRLADVARLSPFHFARAFRDDIGDPPHRYVLRRRIARAEDLVRHSMRPLADVALACGFSSQSRLNDAFSRELGTCPGAMRRAMRS